MKKLLFTAIAIFIVSAAIAIFIVSAAIAQGSETASTRERIFDSALPEEPMESIIIEPTGGDLPKGNLVIRRNSIYTIGGQRTSREDLLNRVAPSVPGLAEQINKGVKIKREAIGLGISGGAMVLGGLFIMANSRGDRRQPITNSGRRSYHIGLGIYISGMAMGLTAVGIGVGSGIAKRKAMRLYNDAAVYAQNADPEATLSLAATRGGLGVQLAF